MTWQTIETAPRDGSWILLSGGASYSDEPIGACVAAFWDDNEWAYSFWDGAWRSVYVAPTHWMPLPEPPIAVNTGCHKRLAHGQHWAFCGETDMGQTLPALCTRCGGQYVLAEDKGGPESHRALFGQTIVPSELPEPPKELT